MTMLSQNFQAEVFEVEVSQFLVGIFWGYYSYVSTAAFIKLHHLLGVFLKISDDHPRTTIYGK